MLENEMKISLTLVAFDKMSKVLRDAVHKTKNLQNSKTKSNKPPRCWINSEQIWLNSVPD